MLEKEIYGNPELAHVFGEENKLDKRGIRNKTISEEILADYEAFDYRIPKRGDVVSATFHNQSDSEYLLNVNGFKDFIRVDNKGSEFKHFEDLEKGDEIERFSKHYVDRPHEEYLQAVMPTYQGDNHTSNWLNEEFAKTGADSSIDKVFRTDITKLIVDDPVKRVDNMTMAWGLEARVPFLDTELVEWALKMPAKLKMKQEGKYPLKKIARDLLPSSVIDRKKGYFPMPALKYVQGDFLEFMSDILTSSACLNRGVFDQKYVNKVINSPRNYMTALNGSRLWHLALFEFWMQVNVDR